MRTLAIDTVNGVWLGQSWRRRTGQELQWVSVHRSSSFLKCYSDHSNTCISPTKVTASKGVATDPTHKLSYDCTKITQWPHFKCWKDIKIWKLLWWESLRSPSADIFKKVRHTPRTWQLKSIQKHVHKHSLQLYLRLPTAGNNPNVHQVNRKKL